MNPELKEFLLRVRWWIFHMNRRQIRKWVYQVTRPASDPYVTGDGFRRLAKYVYDETNRRIPVRRIMDGDAIFVCTDYIREFFERVSPSIAARYKLITHNSIIPVDEELTALMPERVIAWFAKNNTFQHDRVVPIPLGLENLHRYNVGVPGDYTELRGYSGPRKNRILAGFTVGTNPAERQPVMDLAATAPCVEAMRARLRQREYLGRLVSYKFLLSPPGSGLDANRTWEAMYLGVVPIVKDSVALRYFADLGLPLWVLRGWDELLSLHPDELEAKYEALKGGFDSPALFMDYWRNLIREPNSAMPGEASGRSLPSATPASNGGALAKATPTDPGSSHTTIGTRLA
jgi:hypothetical protein